MPTTEPVARRLKIVALTAENIKRIRAIHIEPDGNMVVISGPNGAGKTSVLDCFWWALAGASHIQSVPIREGADTAFITLDLGEIVVKRTFRRTKKGDLTTSIICENVDGSRFQQPQTMLDSLLGELSFDPLAFTRMKPREQYDLLADFVPAVNFAEITAENAKDYDERTNLSRDAKRFRAAFESTVVPDGASDEIIDEAALVDELQSTVAGNSAIETEKARRAAVKTEAFQINQDADRASVRIEELQAQIDTQTRLRVSLLEEAKQGLKTLESLPELAEPIDISTIRTKIDSGRAQNNIARDIRARAALLADAEINEKLAQARTDSITARNAAKEKAISEATLPVVGIGFGDEEILLNGLPFNQASDAEQLRASIAIAMASNPTFRVIRVRDGSLLDTASMEILAAMADESDYQVWVERVDDSGKIGFVLEDGHLKGDDSEAAAD